MIEEKEIRLGNWFHHNKEWSNQNRDESAHYFKFESIHWYWMHEGCFYLENIDPIPLTEEWLKRMGFTEMKSRRDGIWLDIDILKISFRFQKGKLTMWLQNHVVDSVKYVHSLQNLYHSLTGEELEVK